MITTFSLLLSFAANPPACKPATGDAAAILHRAADVIGLTRASGLVMRSTATDVVVHDYESDRTYAPFLLQASRFDEWYDPSTAVDRMQTTFGMIGGSNYGAGTTLGTANASYAVANDTMLMPSPPLHSQLYITRPLNAWTVIADWIAAGDAHVTGQCMYREYPRLVLTHNGVAGPERLYIDAKSGYPAALERVEKHYLWGQRRVEYVYSTWTRSGNAHFPGASFRIVDGTAEITRTFGSVGLIPRDSAPVLRIPATNAPMQLAIAPFLNASNPDTIRVSSNVVILRNQGYAETVMLARDTVFVFDATQSEDRARLDSAWIGKLFPGRHPISVIVTDLAWPHISGVRFWVARGATIISPNTARAFLDSVVKRRWTAAPDELEKHRGTAKLKFIGVGDSLRLGGGAVTLFPIDGLSSEIALAAFVHGARFLWASDFIQSLRQPTQYADEVAAAVKRMHYEPLKVAAEHLPLTDWQRVVRVTSLP